MIFCPSRSMWTTLFSAATPAPNMNVRLPLLCSCCSRGCGFRTVCVSWVWRYKSRECYLKSKYYSDGSRAPCDDCVAYEKTGVAYTFGHEKKPGTEKREKETEPVLSVGKDATWQYSSGSITDQCTYIEGYDQPAEHDMLEKPVQKPSAFACCQACSVYDGVAADP